MLETVAGFDWDAGNLEKCQKHGVGKTHRGRYVFLVFTIRERHGERLIRPIIARYMHRKEVAHYEEENPGL